MSEDTVFGYFYRGSDEDMEELYDVVEDDPLFERNSEFKSPVYDSQGSRVVLYRRSNHVRLLQKEGFYFEFDLDYDVEDRFELVNRSLKASGEGSDWLNL